MVARAIFISAVAFRVNRERGPCATSPPTSSIGGGGGTPKTHSPDRPPMAAMGGGGGGKKARPPPPPPPPPPQVPAVGGVGPIMGGAKEPVEPGIVPEKPAIVRRGDCSAD